jgi:hypothetical protein
MEKFLTTKSWKSFRGMETGRQEGSCATERAEGCGEIALARKHISFSETGQDNVF